MNDLKEDYKQFVTQVLRSSLSSVASYTAPAKVQRGEKDPKKAIKKLREKVLEKMGGNETYIGSPLDDDRIFAKDGKFSPTGIYIRDPKSKKRHTNIQTIKDPATLKEWWYSNTTYNEKKNKRIRKRDAVVFISSANVLKSLIRTVQKRVGNFMSGWQEYATQVQSKITKFIPAGNYDYQGSAWWVDNTHSMDFAADNESAPSQSLAKYNQAVMDTYMPKQIEFHARKTLPFFVRSIQKKYNLTAKEAGTIVHTLIL